MAAHETLGVDIGGTKTHLAVGAGPDLVRERIVRTDDWRSSSRPRDAAALHEMVRSWRGEQADGWPLAVGARGCDSTSQCEEFARDLGKYFRGPVRVVNDAELLAPAVGLPTGIGVVAGTGSIAVARDAAGRLVTAGGWGWVLGDEGSAAGLVRAAVQAILGARDRGEAPGLLGRRLLASFGVADEPELAAALSTARSAGWVGGHAVEVFRAADEGSSLAARVVAQAASELAGLVDRLADRGVAADNVVVAGAVILAQSRLRDLFTAAVAASRPDTTVRVLDRPPVLGALVLADAL
ncbi:BadF/BadG/BcrA/BcrD ATPase family protein [Plantactinospora sp. WMMC1484]|uniref:BadF/BadG/BcrA/BcrD ATPase family protein n=1 Tax=Plantactinospora sp. WMMC1484 TaxID=3404122 RepID=UPI003BF5DADF